MKHQKQAVLLLVVNPLNGQEVLSVSRKDDHKKLGLPGGKVDEEETLLNALLREIKEELNFELDPSEVEFLFQDWDEDYDTLTYVYSGDVSTLSQDPWINSEGALVEYVLASKLINPLSSPFSDYNLKMFKRFISDLDFISFQKNTN